MSIISEVVGIGDFQAMITEGLNASVGKQYIIIDLKKHLIVGKVKVLEAPKELQLTETFTRKEVKKDESNS